MTQTQRQMAAMFVIPQIKRTSFACRLLPFAPTVHIYYYYSAQKLMAYTKYTFYSPTEGKRLSLPRH